MSRAPERLTKWRKARLAAHIWWSFVLVHLLLRREPLPEVVRRLGADGVARWPSLPPRRLSRLVERCLRIGRWRPRCLIGALVLFRLLRSQGAVAELVIGLPEEADGHEAHAWVEIDGLDVGPPPGRGAHEPLARYR